MKIKAVMKLGQFLVVAAASVAAMTSCDKPVTSTSSSGLAKIACDETFENIMQQEIEVFEYIYPKASIMPYYVSEQAAIDSLLNVGDVRTIVTTRRLTDDEVKYLESKRKHVKQSKIAVDAIALIVNPKNDMTEPITERELAQVLEGKITRWDQLGPSKMGKIDVVFEHQGSSTVKYMRDSLMNGAEFGPNVFAQKTNKDVFRVVEENPNALGIIGVSWISSDLKGRELSTEELAQSLEKNDTTDLGFNDLVRVLPVRGDSSLVARKPYQAYIFDGSYPLYRSIYMITVAANGSLGHGFYSFVTGFQGQKLIQMTGILPATVRPRMVNVN
ncbi:MAG: phosphate ABC transporter substrate-binding protein [Bacteroides sp.]|nr:phosphate ABC transporter substrate-binding protein [Bacteroides sp.]MBD5376367.1 phosphate ABC transporter substrate-binding protein [Bacteroides sp.]